MFAALKRHALLMLTLPATLMLAVLVLTADLNADASARSAQRADRLRAQVMLAGLTQQYLGFTVLEVQQAVDSRAWTLTPQAVGDRAALDGWLASSPLRFVGAVLSDLTGAPLTSAGQVATDPNDPSLARLRADLLDGRPGLSGALRGARGPLVAVALPVQRLGAPVGLLLAFADPHTWALQTYVQGLDLGPHCLFAVLDSQGRAVAASDPSRLGTQMAGDAARSPVLREQAGTVVSAAPVGTDAWVAVTQQPTSDFYAALGTARRWLLVALAGLCLALVGGLVAGDLRRRRVLDQLADEAIFDRLTGAATRRLLDLRLSAALARYQRAGAPLAVLFCDLDRFKQVNDRYGHAAGDLVLRTVAHRIKDELRDEDFLARVGGDEFVIVIENAGDRTIERIADRVVVAVGEPVQAEHLSVTVGISIGIATADAALRETEALLRAADQAMYAAKASGAGYAVHRPVGTPPQLIQQRQAARRSGDPAATASETPNLTDG